MQAAYKDIVNIQEVAARFQASMPIVDAIEMGFSDEPNHALSQSVKRFQPLGMS
jgi:hypothetical protein